MDAHLSEAEIHKGLLEDFIRNKCLENYEIEHFIYILDNLVECLMRRD